MPVITELYPQGVPELNHERREALRAAKPAFDRAWNAWNADRESAAALISYHRARDA